MGEVWTEVVGGDLGAWPPEWFGAAGRGLAAAAGRVGEQVVGLSAGDQEAAKDGAQGCRLVQRSAALPGDHVCDDVRLLRGDPTLLYRRGSDVPGGIDVRDTADLPELVGGKEPILVVGQAGDANAAGGRDADDPVGPPRGRVEDGLLKGGQVGDERIELFGREDSPPVRHADDWGMSEDAARDDHVLDLLGRIELCAESGP